MDSLAVIKEGISEEGAFAVILNGFGEVEYVGKRVCDVVMNPLFFSGLRKLCIDVIEHTVEHESFFRGHVASLWGANVWTDKSLEEHDVRFYSDEDSLLQQDFPKIKEFKNELGLE